MVTLRVNRIFEDGTKRLVDLNVHHICLVDSISEKSKSFEAYKPTELKILKETTSVVALSNGVVLWIEYNRDKLINVMRDAR